MSRTRWFIRVGATAASFVASVVVVAQRALDCVDHDEAAPLEADRGDGRLRTARVEQVLEPLVVAVRVSHAVDREAPYDARGRRPRRRGGSPTRSTRQGISRGDRVSREVRGKRRLADAGLRPARMKIPCSRASSRSAWGIEGTGVPRALWTSGSPSSWRGWCTSLAVSCPHLINLHDGLAARATASSFARTMLYSSMTPARVRRETVDDLAVDQHGRRSVRVHGSRRTPRPRSCGSSTRAPSETPQRSTTGLKFVARPGCRAQCAAVRRREELRLLC
jgi:hypothetical protein